LSTEEGDKVRTVTRCLSTEIGKGIDVEDREMLTGLEELIQALRK
jgi:hypothetical protein